MTSWEEEGLKKGLQREIDFILRLVKKRFGSLRQSAEKNIRALPVEKVEELGEALFDFKSEKDMESWLKKIAK